MDRKLTDYFVGWEVSVDLFLYTAAEEDGEFTIVRNEDGLLFKFKTDEWKALNIDLVEEGEQI